MTDFTSPSWRQLAAIPESLTKSLILKALDISPPPEGVSNVFMDHGLYVRFSPDQDTGSHWIVSHAPSEDRSFSSTIHSDGSSALGATRTKGGTPTGDALRAWMRSKGWLPRKERDLAAAQADTKTII